MSGDHPLKSRLETQAEHDALVSTLRVLRTLAEAAPICLDVEEVALHAGLLSDPQVLDPDELRATARRLAHLVSRGAAMEVVSLGEEPPQGHGEQEIWTAVAKERAELPEGLIRGKASPLVFVSGRVGRAVRDIRRKLNEHRQDRTPTEKGLSLIRTWTITERGREILAQEST